VSFKLPGLYTATVKGKGPVRVSEALARLLVEAGGEYDDKGTTYWIPNPTVEELKAHFIQVDLFRANLEEYTRAYKA
jgi:hypothetical protein